MTSFVPVTVPDTAHLTDSGRWQELGVTHWHLVREEIATHDRLRYTAQRWQGVRFKDHTADPRKALEWIAKERMAVIHRASDPEHTARKAGMGSEEAWIERHEATWLMLTSGFGPAGGGIRISVSRSVDVFATPMSVNTCIRHSGKAKR